MTVDVYGFSNPVWVVTRRNAHLWRVSHDESGTTYLLEVSRFGASWPTWFCALDGCRLKLWQTRSGKPMLQLIASDDAEAKSAIELAVNNLYRAQREQRFYVGLGWRRLDA